MYLNAVTVVIEYSEQTKYQTLFALIVKHKEKGSTQENMSIELNKRIDENWKPKIENKFDKISMRPINDGKLSYLKYLKVEKEKNESKLTANS